MKILNILITLLVISILISGGFLGYLVYTQNNPTEDLSNDDDNEDIFPTPTDNTNPTPVEDEMISDEGCGNLFSQGNGSIGSLADIQFNFTPNTNGTLNEGDKILVKAEVLSANPTTVWKGIELKMIFPCENLKFVKSIPPANGEYYNIDVAKSFDNIAEVHIVTTKDSFMTGDEIVQLEFEVVKNGADLNLEIADSSTILDDKTQKFSIATNKINL